MIIGPIRISRAQHKGIEKKRVGAATLELSGKHDLISTRILLHLSANWSGAHQHYRHWRAIFINSGLPFICVIRPQGIFDACRREFPQDPLILAKRQLDVDALLSLCPNVAAVFFTNHGGNNCHFFAHPELANIFIGHGESDKAGSVSLMARTYDEVWTAGQAQIDKLAAKMDRVNFRVVGRPQVANLYSSIITQEKTSLTAAYLPTWEGISPDLAQYSSLLLASEFVDILTGKEINIHAKFHPSTGARDKQYRQTKNDLESQFIPNLQIASSLCDVIDIMCTADFCIADTSSIVPDWLTTHRPLFMYYPKAPRSTTRMHPSEYAYTFTTIDEFAALIDRVVISDDDWKRDSRIKAANYWISEAATKANAFISSMHEVIDTQIKQNSEIYK